MDFRADGVLFASVNIAGDGGTGSDHLAVLDTATGAATIVGPFGSCAGVSVPSLGGGVCSLEGMEAIAFDASGQLWGALSTRGRAGAPGLYAIDTATGAATFLRPIVDLNGAPPSGGIVSLQFLPDGRLLGGTARAIAPLNDGGRLVVIDPATGVFSFLGSGPASSGRSLAALAFAGRCAAGPRSAGFWSHNCDGPGSRQVDPVELSELLAEAASRSSAFDECAPLGCDVLGPDPPGSDMREKAARQALALWLNVASERLPAESVADLPELTGARTAGEAAAEVDAILCDASAPRSDLERAKDLAETLNGGDDDLALDAAAAFLTAGPGQIRAVVLTLANLGTRPRSFRLSVSGPWEARPERTTLADLPAGGSALVSIEVLVPRSAETVGEGPVLRREASVTIEVRRDRERDDP
jgi:hypothetical protein